MKYSCDLIVDMMPMYCSNLCSITSANIIREHLDSCDKCRSLCSQMNSYAHTTQEEAISLAEDIFQMANSAETIKKILLTEAEKTPLQ